MQPVNDADFDVTVKFDSALTQRIQQQGVLVQADTENLIRMEFHFDGANTKLFAATLVGGVPTTRVSSPINLAVPPYYLRVTRFDDEWSLAYSSDGVSWTSGGSFEHSLGVTSVGVFSANGWGPVEHTATVDYLINNRGPIPAAD
jgi:regulation of enolase protein 1 (concanavalin A-like superfamily)